MSAFEVVRQLNVHIERGDSVLDSTRLICNFDRMPDCLDTNFVDRKMPSID
jgi:hypothetical protein